MLQISRTSDSPNPYLKLTHNLGQNLNLSKQNRVSLVRRISLWYLQFKSFIYTDLELKTNRRIILC